MARSVNKTVSVFQATPRHDFFEYTLNIENYRLPHEYFQRAEKKCKERMKMKSFKKRLKRTMSRRLILISWSNVEEKKGEHTKKVEMKTSNSLTLFTLHFFFLSLQLEKCKKNG